MQTPGCPFAIRSRVHEILETGYHLDFNTIEKILDHYFSNRFLPQWYFHANSPEEIASHVFAITQLLTAQNTYITQASADGQAITYLLNIGRDYPGRLESILRENLEMRFCSFDAVLTRSGIGIITLERSGRIEPALTETEMEGAGSLLERIRRYGSENGHRHTAAFITCLTPAYIVEEISSTTEPPRVHRHQRLFERSMESDRPVVVIEPTDRELSGDNEHLAVDEVRIVVALKNPSETFAIDGVSLFTQKNINIRRAYFDTFTFHPAACGGRTSIGILSIYVVSGTPLDGIESALANLPPAPRSAEESGTLYLVEDAIRAISRDDTPDRKIAEALARLRHIAAANGDTRSAEEQGVFLLNSLTDFFESARMLGVADNDLVMRMLLRFEAFDEFWVEQNEHGRNRHLPGFRTKHNSARGTVKGGLRIDPIVEFVEVSALAFMMTWKCARSRILFGGGKGGLKTTADYHTDNRLETFDTLANFGRSLFLVTGPFRDVPAGDVGCGPREIGNMFEGFKSALRDLALMAYGFKHGATLFGNQVISTEEARRILLASFGIHYQDRETMRELVYSERYLGLVAAAQITGKPFMGIRARGGATGRGLVYCLLAAVTRLYLDGKWKPSGEELDGEEEALLRRMASYRGSTILEGGGRESVDENTWGRLCAGAYRKLLAGKKIVLQGSGKVGGSMLEELAPFGANLIAVADKDGAIVGDDIPIGELLAHVRKTGTVVGFESGVERTIVGAAEGARVLEIPCDVLVPAALENALTAHNAPRITARVVLCGSNGPNTSKAEKILFERGIVVLYDFLANSAGVVASYFEWLRNLEQRFRYEAEEIRGEPFDPDAMDPYIMPEFLSRIKKILTEPENEATTERWNGVIRDIMFSAVNDDYVEARAEGISMKTAGYRIAIARVLAAMLLREDPERRFRVWETLAPSTRRYLEYFFRHPEARLHTPDAGRIYDLLERGE